MKQLKYILKRILHMIPVLFIVTILIFLMIHMIPGSAAELILGDRATPEMVAAMEAKMGLDKPLVVQYFIYLKQVVTFDFGDSVKFVRPVSELIGTRIGVTFALVLLTTFFVVLFSFPLGYLAGRNNGGVADNVIKGGTLIGISVPQFWIGTILLLTLALRLHWFPVGEWGNNWLEHLHALILPAISGGLSTWALMTRSLRTNVIDVMNSDYVDFAYCKGLPSSRIMSRHVIRNSMVSTVTLLALRVANMLGGSIVIETVFSLPGLGKLLVDSIFARDYAVVQTSVLFLAFIVLVINLITDIAYSMLDPRVRLD